MDPQTPPPIAPFAPATAEDWRKLADAVLKGAPFSRLESKTYDGLAIAPLYPRTAAARPVTGRAPGAAWTVMARIDHPDPAAANQQARDDLDNGATGLTLVFAGSLNAGGFGLDPAPTTLAHVLDGITLDAGVAIDLNLSEQSRYVVRDLAALVKSRGLAPAAVDLRGSINAIGGLAATGRLARPWGELAPYFAATVAELAAEGFGGPFAVGDGRVVHNAGGSEAQELGFALAAALAYLRALEAGGMALAAARDAIYFRLAADADQFLTMAKFRAMRKLWCRVEAACGLTPKPVRVAAETAWRMMARRDPHVNMLRTAIAVAAAALGGADSIAVLPHTAALGLPDPLARRIARNTQLVLLEESNLFRVADPAAGSGAIEDLTEQLCHAAWAFFQEIERGGGAAAALESGLIQEKVGPVRDRRLSAVAHGRDPLTGVSLFADLNDVPVSVLQATPVAPDDDAEPQRCAPLPRIRLAEPFERLRDVSDAILAKTGARPKIFLTTLGAPADFTARAGFAKNFFEAGGIEAVERHGGETKLAADFNASGAALACLCGSDKTYQNEAAKAAAELQAAGARHIYLAGAPGPDEAAYRNAGVQTFIYAGCDTLATLEAAERLIAS
jgi:methylmalonyl-CoA mutase